MGIDIEALRSDLEPFSVLESLGLDPSWDKGKISFLCPAHEDKHKGSCFMKRNGRWHCFSCRSGGDIFAAIRYARHIPESDFGKVLEEAVTFAGGGNYRSAGKAKDPGKKPFLPIEWRQSLGLEDAPIRKEVSFVPTFDEAKALSEEGGYQYELTEFGYLLIGTQTQSPFRELYTDHYPRYLEMVNTAFTEAHRREVAALQYRITQDVRYKEMLGQYRETVRTLSQAAERYATTHIQEDVQLIAQLSAAILSQDSVPHGAF